MNTLMFILSCIAITAIGCFLHFLYNMAHKNKLVAIFAATNESVWEHVKIGLSGFFLWTIVDAIYYGSNKNYWVAKTASVLIFSSLIIAMYYVEKLFLKKHVLWLSILEFVVAIVAGQGMFYWILACSGVENWMYYPTFILLFLVFAGYLVFTWIQPKWDLFRDPRNGKYGLEAHSSEKHTHNRGGRRNQARSK